MKQISSLKFFFLITFYSCSFLYSSPIIAPISFCPSVNFKQVDKEIFSTKIGSVLARAFNDFESFLNQNTLVDVRESFEFVRENLSNFSMCKLDKIFDALLRLSDTCLYLKDEGALCCKQLYSAVHLIAALELSKKADEVFIESIMMLDKNARYWNEQQAHPYYYFFHRSPTKWFSKTSREAEITLNKKCISDVLHQYEGALGENALLRAEFNDHASLDEQFLWIKRCCIDISKICLKNPLHEDAITQENCGQIIKQLYASLNKHKKIVEYRVCGATMPPHFERNWALYAGLTVAAVSGYLYMRRHPDVIHNSFRATRNFFVKNYTNHLKEPLGGIKKELFIDKNDRVSMAQALNTIVEQSSPTEEMKQELRDDIYKFYVNIDKSLEMKCSEEELRLKSNALDRGYFLRFLHKIFSEKWPEGGVVIQGWLSPFAKTTKSKVVDEIPAGFTLLARLTEYQAISLSASGVKVVFNKIDEIEKRVNLTLAIVSLLPAYFVATKSFSAFRKFGGFLLPKGYDDTPVKNWITAMQNFLDDILYIDSLKTYDTLDAHSVGKLLYYSSQLEDEIQHLSQKNRIALNKLLEKFYITNDLCGKRVYLKKMLAEYASWPRFIKR